IGRAVLTKARIEMCRARAEPEMVFPYGDGWGPQPKTDVFDLSCDIKPFITVRRHAPFPKEHQEDRHENREKGQGLFAVITLSEKPVIHHGETDASRKPAAA